MLFKTTVRHLFTYGFLIAASWICCLPAHAQPSVLSTGDWHKLAVEKEGVYKINYDLLKKMGLNPASINPSNIRMYGNEGGMLPQANAAPRPDDLQEIAIMIVGEEDGKFDKNDYILFYAQSAHAARLNATRGVYYYEKNLYADRNFYFLTLSSATGKRIGVAADEGDGTVVSTFDDYVFHEVDDYNELKSGRDWFGERFDVNPVQTFEFALPGMVQGSTATLVSDVMGQTYSAASFDVFVNNAKVRTQNISTITSAKYDYKGADRRDTIAVDMVSAESPLRIKYQFNKGASGRSIGFLDYFLFSFKRTLALYNDQTIFASIESLQNTTSKFQIADASSDVMVWDITDHYNVVRQAGISAGGFTFSTTTGTLKKFIAFNGKTLVPAFDSKVPAQNLHGQPTPNLLIVTHPAFLSEATRLANHRTQHSGLSVLVVTTDQVYNEFSSGRQDVSAIRDFAKHLYQKSAGVLQNLLLIGRGSYDYKDRLTNNTNFVPAYESRESHAPLLSYSSDDFFAMLDDNEGRWGEDPIENNYLDIGVGRLPVRTLQEATNVVSKLITYDTEKKQYSSWRKELVFVADDGDGNLHTSQSNQLAQYVDANYAAYNTRKVFLDAYAQIAQPGGETSPEMKKAIVRNLDRGALVMNYTGHGGERLWAQEKIFDDFLMNELDNSVLPLFVTATCAFGRQDDPFEISGAESCLTRASAGVIALVSTGRDVNSGTNFELNFAFFEAFFEKENNAPLTLGEIFRRTKNNSTTGVANRNFSLMGDPSMTLAIPRQDIQISSIKTQNDSDTLKALSTVVVTGTILNTDGEQDTAFDGFVEGTLFDKETDFTTLGNENAPFNYSQWYNALFRGRASVEEGQFTMSFVVPKNIAYATGYGKFSFYAADPQREKDATAGSVDFVIGKSETDPASDNAPPAVAAFIGDTTFVNGGYANSNTTLVVQLSDESGINISTYGIANSLIAELDASSIYQLSDFYLAALDDFTTGWVHFPLHNLEPGRHTITVYAWDTHNNPASATVEFVVADANAMAIETFGNYPNPFGERTTLYFTHNRSGEDLEASISIHDVAGNTIKTATFLIKESPYLVNLLEIEKAGDLGKKLPGGLYLARLVVRSLTDGTKNERVTKLISVN